MASSEEFVRFVCDQMGHAGKISYRKMFGDYGVYCDGKIFALICDNRLFVKITKAGGVIWPDLPQEAPYEGAKQHFAVDDVEDAEKLSALVTATCSELPLPKQKNHKEEHIMQYATLNTGAKMPLEGFGVFQIPDAAECERVVYDAIKTGYRLLDTAAAYRNEEALGKAVKRAIADGLVTREELFITTKVWVQDEKNEDTAYEAVKTSLAKLGLPYVDLVLLHQALGDYFAAYRGITRAYKEGLTKAVGVSNFYPFVLANFCENAEVIPAVNQVELHPFFAQEDAIALMKQYGIVPQAWGPLAEGKHGIFTDPVLTEIGKKYGKSAAQVVLRWNVQRGVSILPKSTHVERMAQNIDIWDFELTEDEMKTIGAKDLGHSEIINHFDPQLVKMLCGMKIHE